MKRSQIGFTFFEFIIGVAVLIVIVVVFKSIYDYQQEKNNDNFFSNLASSMQIEYQNQASAIGINASSSDLQKTCSYGTPEVYGKPFLTCSILIDKKIQVKPDIDYVNALIAKLDLVTKKAGFQQQQYVSSSTGNKYTPAISLSERGGIYSVYRPLSELNGETSKLFCSVDLNYQPFSAYQDAKTAAGYTFDCHKRASRVPQGFTLAQN